MEPTNCWRQPLVGKEVKKTQDTTDEEYFQNVCDLVIELVGDLVGIRILFFLSSILTPGCETVWGLNYREGSNKGDQQEINSGTGWIIMLGVGQQNGEP